MANKTAKKILVLLAEKDISESDIAAALNLPLNTVGYNIKNLLDAGLIEKSKNYFWSSRGKKIPTYRVSNKRIIISPRSAIKGVVPALLISGVLALGVKYFINSGISGTGSNYANDMAFASEKVSGIVSSGSSASAAPSLSTGSYDALVAVGHAWLWFLLGALVALFVFMVWNWRKIWK
jgi:DNA-binding transcriptional ArsR family regulator